ncbi:hypothetical protein NB491_20325 [Vibrio alginolyticus]|uniref:hypothetical protein n=1 Tax=Vibrio TaxID=662 RepID=UPI001BB06BD6|nr:MULTISPECIES: hypothetical protein [Vibrio]EGR2699517.1 hypothetical protein [Vibrio parahaemolyticus]MCQ9070209.1 hypothetical protein [Vibrio alginolyticus]MCR9638294.1 hypothetical protein [Vibrio alginolyticus]MDF4568605.1 hypothetical protein [Vibrio parahaemolyticus]MDF4960564.1 hypothetical protein [Vibrio parahaemolyticus]
MLKITVSIETQLPKAEFYTLARNKHYRIKTVNQTFEWLPVPERLFSDFQHQFENVGTREKQNKRKKALSAIVQAAYLCAIGVRPLQATEELYLCHNNVRMTFKVTPEVKSMFFHWFKDVRQDKNAKSRWYVLNALVYYAWLAAKHP